MQQLICATDADLETDVGMMLAKTGKDTRQPLGPKSLNATHTHKTSFTCVQFGDDLLSLLQRFQSLPGIESKLLTGLRQINAFIDTLEKLNPHLGLQCGNL